MTVTASMAELPSPSDSDPRTSTLLDSALRLDPMVSLRPEPFGALAYHFGTRRLSFLRSPDIVAVVNELDSSASVSDALTRCGINEQRWPSFASAIATLIGSGMLQPALVGDEPAAGRTPQKEPMA